MAKTISRPLVDASKMVQIKAFGMFSLGEGISSARCVATSRLEKHQLTPFEPMINATPSGHPDTLTTLKKSCALVRVLDMADKVMTMTPTVPKLRSNIALDSFGSTCSKQAAKHVMMLTT